MPYLQVVKGLFVDSTYNISQGTTDFGYYIDGGRTPGSGDELVEMVENDEAYFVEVFPVQNSGVFIRLRSDNRRFTSELGDEIGKRKRGLSTTLYQATGDPILPRNYDGRERKDEAIAFYTEYALEHGKGKGLEAEGVDWDNLLERGRDF